MNTSVPLLLCLLLSTTHGEKEKDPLQTSLTIKEPSCPEPLDILPCVCDVAHMRLDCSNVEDEAQLRQVFTAYFPSTAFSEFFMSNNMGVRVLEDGVFGKVSFHTIMVLNSALEIVRMMRSPVAFIHSLSLSFSPTRSLSSPSTDCRSSLRCAVCIFGV
ncbi:uncharacterized protein LOC123501667 [Portunus trituberculatus]|uniref:uncharacterized protein LOC123501667 n=1 Tax=Portunus trituberculatus TaxID=210409 RepID=UPI001E1D0C0B|nr:uncharacterized protein LOC123501667 [Portunus trituberculatus]